jgi:trigger factor
MTHEASDQKIKAVSPSRREIELMIPPAIVESEIETILADYASKAKLPGFRKGTAPRDIVKRMFLAEIRQDAVESLIPKSLEDELKSADLRPVSVPVIQDAHFEDDQTLHARVGFDVIPDFDLPAYKNIRLEKPAVVVEDKDVERALEELRQRAAEYVPAEGRGVADGDYVAVEIHGRDLKTKRFFPVEKSVVLAGHPENENDLNSSLAGMKAGEERMFTVAYPGDHANKKLAGKNVEYRLKVQSVKEKKVPLLDDELAKTLGDYGSLEDLRNKVRAALLSSRESSGKSKLASELLEKIAAEVKAELPRGLVEDETRAVLRRVLGAHPQARLSTDQAAGLAAESRRQAEANVKNDIILTRIARAEGISVSEPEIQDEMKALAEANRVSLAKVVETVDKDGRREDLEENILFRKTIDFLLGQAIIE